MKGLFDCQQLTPDLMNWKIFFVLLGQVLSVNYFSISWDGGSNLKFDLFRFFKYLFVYLFI